MNKIDCPSSYREPGYAGAALKLTTGITVREVYEAAGKNGVTVLGAVSWVSITFRHLQTISTNDQQCWIRRRNDD
jgi:hypothetical protein